MIVKEFDTKDGKGKSYKPENGDEIIAKASTVYTSNPRPVVIKATGKAVNIINRGISAEWEGQEIFCTLTEGQCKILSKTEDLLGKTIVFENYESKDYGTLVGARVKA